MNNQHTTHIDHQMHEMNWRKREKYLMWILIIFARKHFLKIGISAILSLDICVNWIVFTRDPHILPSDIRTQMQEISNYFCMHIKMSDVRSLELLDSPISIRFPLHIEWSNFLRTSVYYITEVLHETSSLAQNLLTHVSWIESAPRSKNVINKVRCLRYTRLQLHTWTMRHSSIKWPKLHVFGLYFICLRVFFCVYSLSSSAMLFAKQYFQRVFVYHTSLGFCLMKPYKTVQ